MLVLLIALLGAAGTPPAQTVEKLAARLRAVEPRPSTLSAWIEGAIDLEEIRARLLGPHRRTFSAEQQREFSRLFVAILVARAWQRAEALRDFEIACQPGEGSTVRCDLSRGNEKTRASFTLRAARIVDARLGDMGLVKENREAIDRIVRARGVDGLLEQMRRVEARTRKSKSKRR